MWLDPGRIQSGNGARQRHTPPPTPAEEPRRQSVLAEEVCVGCDGSRSIAALIALVPAAFSYVETMAEPSNSSLGIRSVEWLRDHGAAGLVSKVESAYYSLTAPSKGGPTLKALPQVGYGAAERAQAQRLKPGNWPRSNAPIGSRR